MTTEKINAERAEFLLAHFKSAQLRFHTSGPNIGQPKGMTVIFDFTQTYKPDALAAFIDEARKGGA